MENIQKYDKRMRSHDTETDRNQKKNHLKKSLKCQWAHIFELEKKKVGPILPKDNILLCITIK